MHREAMLFGNVKRGDIALWGFGIPEPIRKRAYLEYDGIIPTQSSVS